MSPDELHDECHQLAEWWMEFGVDHDQGGFWGQVQYDNTPVREADKCIILNARVLWFFAYAANRLGSAAYRTFAERAYQYLVNHFYDNVHGGFYWMVDCNGQALDKKKHVYAQAFCIYALSEYCVLTQLPQAKHLAIETYELIETHAREPQWGGYFESFTETWLRNTDVRLSEKEDNHPKTMNTHLHLLEAYTGLLTLLMPLRETADELEKTVRASLVNVIDVYCTHIVDTKCGAVKMFMSMDWQDCSTEYSFGHDIESSWLLLKALRLLEAPELSNRYKPAALALGKRALQCALQPSGRMLDEQSKTTDHQSNTAWWVQMEAMVGFVALHKETGEQIYLTAAENIWTFTRQQYKDAEYGEWHWFSRSDLPFSKSDYKTGAWKAPYHTGRALVEVADILKSQ